MQGFFRRKGRMCSVTGGVVVFSGCFAAEASPGNCDSAVLWIEPVFLKEECVGFIDQG